MALNRLVILASGRGSNFVAIAEAIQNKQIPGAQIVGVIGHKKNAPVFKEAEKRGVSTFLIESESFGKGKEFARDQYEDALLEKILSFSPDWICLAGYMLLLGPKILSKFPGKILNIHPSLLPKYKGLHAQRQALLAGEKETGCTVHYVTQELDAGMVICQKKIEILPGDTEESLSRRLLPTEHACYVEALRLLCDRN